MAAARARCRGLLDCNKGGEGGEAWQKLSQATWQQLWKGMGASGCAVRCKEAHSSANQRINSH